MRKDITPVVMLAAAIMFSACSAGEPLISSHPETSSRAITTSSEAWNASEEEPEGTASSGADEAIPKETEDYIIDPMFETEDYLEGYDNLNGTSGFGKSVVFNDTTVYFIKPLGGKYLYYYDRATGFSDVLCGKPNCLHNDDTCEGYIGSSAPGLFLYDGKLYWVSETAEGKETLSKDWRLMRCNPDGSGRESVFTIERELILKYQPQEYYLHRGYLYFSGDTGIVGANGWAGHLISVMGFSLKDNGKKVTILEKECEGGTTRPKLMFSGNSLYYAYAVSNGKDSFGEIDCFNLRNRKTETVWREYSEETERPLFHENAFWLEEEMFYAATFTERGTILKRLENGSWGEIYAPEEGHEVFISGGLAVETTSGGSEGSGIKVNIHDLSGKKIYEGSIQTEKEMTSTILCGGNSEELFLVIWEQTGEGKMQLVRIDIRNQTPPEIIIE